MANSNKKIKFQREYYRLRMDSASMEAYRMLQTNVEFYGFDKKK